MSVVHESPRDVRQHPEPVGVRELKQNASKVIAAVQADHEARVITVNGRPVAGLVPLDVLERVVEAQSIQVVGVSASEFRRRMAENPLPPMSREAKDAWLADIRSVYGDDEFFDPWERQGK
ncbi:type II toxin-antitoxin system Phd/YefM family antitoxin [Frondihabitans australicus]|uniref:Antitoxin n=1 Tax=Frondihabitans australicus TaxID=386892 RepID=A0A495III5_9MICO|nr:type II toxin-antitoxin system Phd/YefM family antitoxin [Frondihabitans australicus]RKR75228.1 prevent-host-death family protein [Frondihabitans australicus]